MKKQKKIKIVSVAGGLAFISLVFTLGLSLFNHPAVGNGWCICDIRSRGYFLRCNY